MSTEEHKTSARLFEDLWEALLGLYVPEPGGDAHMAVKCDRPNALNFS